MILYLVITAALVLTTGTLVVLAARRVVRQRRALAVLGVGSLAAPDAPGRIVGTGASGPPRLTAYHSHGVMASAQKPGPVTLAMRAHWVRGPR